MIWMQTFSSPTALPPPTAVPLPLHRGGIHARTFSVQYRSDLLQIRYFVIVCYHNKFR